MAATNHNPNCTWVFGFSTRSGGWIASHASCFGLRDDDRVQAARRMAGIGTVVLDGQRLQQCKDFMLTTTAAEVQQAHTNAYNLRTIQGYIYQPCTPEPACIPPGAQKFWREFKTAANDCATFLESERTTFETNGYTAACPAGTTKMIGYAYKMAKYVMRVELVDGLAGIGGGQGGYWEDQGYQWYAGI